MVLERDEGNQQQQEEGEEDNTRATKLRTEGYKRI